MTNANPSNKWVRSSLAEDDWDLLCKNFKGNYRQLYAWGEYKKLHGWTVCRYLYKNCGEVEFAVQLLFKKNVLFNAAYIPGGVLGDSSGFCPHLPSLMHENFSNSLWYLRLDNSYDEDKDFFDPDLISQFKKPLTGMNSHERYEVDLDHDLDQVFHHASYRFRREIRKGYNNISKIDVGFSFDDHEVREVSRSMQHFKEIALRDDPSNIIQAINYLKKRIVFIAARNDQDRMIAFRCALLSGNIAYDFYAATTNEGRTLFAGYALLDSVLKECRKLGAKKYSLPISKFNHGDTEFKKRARGEHRLSMGEYELTNFYPMLLAINLIIYLTFRVGFIAKIFKKLNKLKN